MDSIGANGIYAVSYNAFSQTVGCDNYFSENNGVITINQNAPMGMEIYLTALSKHINSVTHKKITIIKSKINE